MRSKITALVAAAAAAAGAATAAKWARGRKGDEELELEVGGVESRSSGGSTAGAPPAPASAPASAPSVAPGEALDDLTAIKGLGKVKAAKLVAAGITSYAQIAAWSDDDIAEMGLVCNTSPGQIKREDWTGQAKALNQN